MNKGVSLFVVVALICWYAIGSLPLLILSVLVGGGYYFFTEKGNRRWWAVAPALLTLVVILIVKSVTVGGNTAKRSDDSESEPKGRKGSDLVSKALDYIPFDPQAKAEKRLREKNRAGKAALIFAQGGEYADPENPQSWNPNSLDYLTCEVVKTTTAIREILDDEGNVESSENVEWVKGTKVRVLYDRLTRPRENSVDVEVQVLVGPDFSLDAIYWAEAKDLELYLSKDKPWEKGDLHRHFTHVKVVELLPGEESADLLFVLSQDDESSATNIQWTSEELEVSIDHGDWQDVTKWDSIPSFHGGGTVRFRIVPSASKGGIVTFSWV